jgi:hypothetical protein
MSDANPEARRLSFPDTLTSEVGGPERRNAHPRSRLRFIEVNAILFGCIRACNVGPGGMKSPE